MNFRPKELFLRISGPKNFLPLNFRPVNFFFTNLAQKFFLTNFRPQNFVPVNFRLTKFFPLKIFGLRISHSKIKRPINYFSYFQEPGTSKNLKKSQWSIEALCKLYEMGFKNVTLNQKLLELYDNDVNKVIDDLLNAENV